MWPSEAGGMRQYNLQTSWSPFEQSPPGYLAATVAKQHPFCKNLEGWGPLSPIRYDFTPCFLDVWIATVAAFGWVFGATAAWWLIKHNQSRPTPRNWHFYTKLASLVIISAVQYLEHFRSRTPNAVVLFYWLFFLIAFAVKLRSLIAQDVHRTGLPYFITYCVTFGLASVQFLLEWLVPKARSPYQALDEQEECPVETANIFSRLTFAWMTPLMKHGYRAFLTEEDLWNLRPSDQSNTTGSQFQHAWSKEVEKKHPSLWLALFRAFGRPYLGAGIFKAGSDVLAFVQPQLLRLLISYIASYRTPSPQPVIRGAAIALTMFAVSVVQTICLHQYFQRAFETGMRIKSSLATAIYAKSLRLSNEGRATQSTGDIVNYMAVDTERLQDLSQYGQQLWSAPLQITLCLLSLYQLIGLSSLAGVGAMILMVPVNALVANMMKSLQKRQMRNKDARSRLMSEILNNMKSIKLYAWTSAFIKKLNHIRNDQELATLRRIGALQAVANFAWMSTPFLVSCATFTVFVLTQDRPLTPDLVFPALTLFNLLAFPLGVLPLVITAIVEATVAVTRLTTFLTAEEVQSDAVIRREALTRPGAETVRIRDASFSWNKADARRTLSHITYSARKGQLSCIVGRVGAGKSSLLQSILGDLWKIHGEVLVHGSIAYVAQQPWITNASIKENILFGHRLDPSFYEATVHACALTDDFRSLPDGDETEVGERGISLSGGQKARLALARAVYARADVYLLDDINSAVDQHVGRHLIDNVLGPKGLLSSKTRILATNSIPVLREADRIVFLRDGTIVEEGTYDELLLANKDVANVIRTSAATNETEDDGPNRTPSGDSASTAIASDDGSEIGEVVDALEELPHLASIASAGGGSARRSSGTTLRRASTASFRGPRGRRFDDEEEGTKAGLRAGQSKEAMSQGKVKWDVYFQYARASNLGAVAVYLVMLLGAQTGTVGGDVWLKQWSEANEQHQQNSHVGRYIAIYFAFGIGAVVLRVVQTLIQWIFCSIEASRKLHERMALAIFRSPMSFFETTPAGRILNRFSSDIYRVDEVLARSFNMLFTNALRAAFTIAVISAGTPAFISLIIPLAFVYLYYQGYYLRASRELKRLDSVSRSPIYAHFQESLGGVSTIRAYRQQDRYALENAWRVDANLRAYFPSISANRWLAVRLEFIGSLIILAAAGFAILNVASGRGLSAGMVGLAMSYCLQITQSLNWIVRQTVEVETNIVSVERVLEYARLPSEAPDIVPGRRPPVSWPAHGAVSFHHYSARYRPELDLALRDIHFDIQPHEKVGVVGRTGAGKSSLTLALFRLIEPASGHIDIDGVNTSTVGLFDLRRRLAIIPQDAALFEGTIRDNLDPDHVHDDAELWSVLEHARLKDHVSNMEGRLDAVVQEGGSNLSQGQRQLISLARALLTPSNILVLDEATAAVDVETDALLQATLRSDVFQQRTIITIAHRINTIVDSDRILVLDHGTVAEFDTPAALVRRRGLFYELAREANLIDSIVGASPESHSTPASPR
ncbi:MAG: hypothetical protein M1823_000551 [Watsoniomyces obsoletus]|nr:MAG: hypothetical protein M1823_000551 [Watsoniomyces obsoletus]